MTGPRAEAVQASIAAHDPQASRTLDETQSGLAHVATAETTRHPGVDAL